MKPKKLKKSLSTVFLSQIYFKHPLFIIEEKTNSLNSYTFLKFLTKFFLYFGEIQLKYPLSIKFFDNISNLQKVLLADSKIIFINLKGLFFKTEHASFRNLIIFKSSFSHAEFFLKKEVILFNYIMFKE